MAEDQQTDRLYRWGERPCMVIATGCYFVFAVMMLSLINRPLDLLVIPLLAAQGYCVAKIVGHVRERAQERSAFRAGSSKEGQ